jgi:drug/metabolite transporter (DMT)-like permease
MSDVRTIEPKPLRGVLYALSGTVVLGLTTYIFSKYAMHRERGLRPMSFACAWTALVIGGWGLLAGELRFAAATDRWGAVVIGALCGPCLGVSLMYLSYRHWALSRTAMVMMAQRLVVLPGSVLVRERELTAYQLAGGVVILAGGMGLVWLHGRAAGAARRRSRMENGANGERQEGEAERSRCARNGDGMT